MHNGDLEIAVRVSQASPPLIFNTSNEVICCLIQRYWLNVLCASLWLSRQLCTEGLRCRRLQNIGDACSMPLLQIQTRCASLPPNLRNCFQAVLSRYTPIIAICKYETRLCARARATRRANSRLATYYYLPRERRVMGLLAVLLRVTQYASAVTSYLSVQSAPLSSPGRFSRCPAQPPPASHPVSGGPRCQYPRLSQDLVFPSSYAPSLVFQPTILRSQGHSWYLLVPRLFFWRGLPFCDKEKACIEGSITLKRVKIVVDNAYVRRF